MKKIILGAILTAGVMLAQATAPANSGTTPAPAKSGTAVTGQTPSTRPRQPRLP